MKPTIDQSELYRQSNPSRKRKMSSDSTSERAKLMKPKIQHIEKAENNLSVKLTTDQSESYRQSKSSRKRKMSSTFDEDFPVSNPKQPTRTRTGQSKSFRKSLERDEATD